MQSYEKVPCRALFERSLPRTGRPYEAILEKQASAQLLGTGLRRSTSVYCSLGVQALGIHAEFKPPTPTTTPKKAR